MSSTPPTFKIHTDEELKGKYKDISNCPGSGSECNKGFGVFTWKHRCRHCVGTFCDSCCPVRGNIMGKTVHLCHECFRKYEQHKKDMAVAKRKQEEEEAAAFNRKQEEEAPLKKNILSSFAKCKLPDRLGWKMEKPLAQWDGIKLNDSGAVVGIIASGFEKAAKIEGPLSAAAWHQLGALFPNLEQINLGFNKLSIEGGVLELGSNLPPGLTHLWLYNNQFSGSVDLTQLPEGLTQLGLSNNKFDTIVEPTSGMSRSLGLWVDDKVNRITAGSKTQQQPPAAAAAAAAARRKIEEEQQQLLPPPEDALEHLADQTNKFISERGAAGKIAFGSHSGEDGKLVNAIGKIEKATPPPFNLIVSLIGGVAFIAQRVVNSRAACLQLSQRLVSLVPAINAVARDQVDGSAPEMKRLADTLQAVVNDCKTVIGQFSVEAVDKDSYMQRFLAWNVRAIANVKTAPEDFQKLHQRIDQVRDDIVFTKSVVAKPMVEQHKQQLPAPSLNDIRQIVRDEMMEVSRRLQEQLEQGLVQISENTDVHMKTLSQSIKTVNDQLPQQLRTSLEDFFESQFDAATGKIGSKAVRVVSVLGKGGFNTVYLGEWQRSAGEKVPVALKPGVARKQTDLLRAHDCPNIVKAYGFWLPTREQRSDTSIVPEQFAAVLEAASDSGIDAEVLVMELVGDDGTNLADDIRKNSFGSDHSVKLTITFGILRALEYLDSRRIAHGDLSPAQALLPNGSNEPKLIDFDTGVQRTTFRATRVESDDKHRAARTASYSPPERDQIDEPRTSGDIFAFAVLLFQLWRAKPESEGTVPEPWGAHKPHEIKDLVKAGKRPATFDEMVSDDKHGIPRVIARIIECCWAQSELARPVASDLRRLRNVAEERNLNFLDLADEVVLPVIARVVAASAAASPVSSTGSPTKQQDDAKFAWMERPELELCDDTKSLLRKGNVGEKVLLELEKADLVEMGILAIGDRKMLLKEIARLKEQ